MLYAPDHGLRYPVPREETPEETKKLKQSSTYRITDQNNTYSLYIIMYSRVSIGNGMT